MKRVAAGVMGLTLPLFPLAEVHAVTLDGDEVPLEGLGTEAWLTSPGTEDRTFTLAAMRTSQGAAPAPAASQGDFAARQRAMLLSGITMFAAPGVVASSAYLASPQPWRLFPMALGAFALPVGLAVVEQVNLALPAHARLKSPWSDLLIVGVMAASMVGYPAYELYDVYRLWQQPATGP